MFSNCNITLTKYDNKLFIHSLGWDGWATICHSHLGTEQLIYTCASRVRRDRSAVRYQNVNGIVAAIAILTLHCQIYQLPAELRKRFGSADCDTLYTIYHSSVHKQLIRTLLKAHIVAKAKENINLVQQFDEPKMATSSSVTHWIEKLNAGNKFRLFS